MRRLLTLGLAALSLGGGAARAGTPVDDSLLRAPGNYSLAPPAVVQGGEVDTSIGSGGMRSTAVRLDSGLIGGSTRAFLEAGTGQGPSWHGRPVVSGSSVAVGVETRLPYGVTLGLEAGFEKDRFNNRLGGFAPGAALP